MSAEELYQQAILSHDESPRNEGRLEAPTHRAKVSNPLCGDRVELTFDVDGETIREVRFVGRGCAISRASASMLTELVVGQTVEEGRRLGEVLRTWLAIGGDLPAEIASLEALGGVRAFPTRVKCATLAWEALDRAVAEP